MENKIKIVMIAGLLSFSSLTLTAQTAPAQTPQKIASAADASTPGIQSGSILYAELSKTLDAKKVKAGDPVTALLLADIISHGKIVAHRDSKLIGHVTEAQARSKETPESRLGITFEKVVLKSGQELPLRSMLIALHPAARPTLDTPTTSVSNRPDIAPGSAAANDSHYPTPSGGKRAVRPVDSTLGAEMDANSRSIARSGPTDIDGLSLATAGGTQAVVSLNRTVKLESGVVIELRITDANGK
jgi:hypothetical protein